MQGLARIERVPSAGSCSAVRRGLAATPRRVEVDLSPQAVERIAVQVTMLLEGRKEGSGQKLLSAGELALRLGVERPWIYRHRHLLGGIRMGSGPKAPWRFEYEAALEGLRRQQEQRNKSSQSQARRRSR
jgi:hypothetical protein